MAETTGEEITPESIDTLESDLKVLESKEEDLAHLVDELRTVESKINDKNRAISVMDDITLPRPGVLSLKYKPAWGDYIGELRRYVRQKEERTKLQGELDTLAKEKDKIITEIIDIVPVSIRHYKPQIQAKQFTMNVYDESVTVTRP